MGNVAKMVIIELIPDDDVRCSKPKKRNAPKIKKSIKFKNPRRNKRSFPMWLKRK
jgi:hypothetical protein